MTTFELPYPIPLASLWTKHKGGGGVPSARYRAYGADAYEAILKQRPQKFKGAVAVLFRIVAPTKQLRDGDNLLKCLFDTLVRNQIIEDDNNSVVRTFSVEWAESGPPCLVTIEPFPPLPSKGLAV